MPALIQEHAHGRIALANNQHRVFAHVSGEEVAGLWNLRFMRHAQPRATEDSFEFELVQLFICIDARVERGALFVDKIENSGARPAGAAGHLRHKFIAVWCVVLHICWTSGLGHAGSVCGPRARDVAMEC